MNTALVTHEPGDGNVWEMKIEIDGHEFEPLKYWHNGLPMVSEPPEQIVDKLHSVAWEHVRVGRFEE